MSVSEAAVDVVVDGERLSATRVAGLQKHPAVLFIHGWGGSQEQYLSRAREVAALGCICLTFNLRGHAESQGRRDSVTREDNLQDVLQAYDTLAQSAGVDPDVIAVIGSSYGGYLAAIATTLRKVRWLGLRAPALYKDEDWDLPKRRLHEQQDLARYRRHLVPAARNRALRACAEYRGDVLLIESERDRVIPHPVVMSYLKACEHARSLTHRVISGADHALSDDVACRAYTDLLVNWLGEMIGGARLEATPSRTAEQPQRAPGTRRTSNASVARSPNT